MIDAPDTAYDDYYRRQQRHSGRRAEQLEREAQRDLEHQREARACLDLAEAIEALEAVEWTAVPTMSPAEAGAITTRLIEARDATREGDQ